MKFLLIHSGVTLLIAMAVLSWLVGLEDTSHLVLGVCVAGLVAIGLSGCYLIVKGLER